MKTALLAVAVLLITSTAYANNCPASPDSTWLVPYWNGTYYWAGYDKTSVGDTGIGNHNIGTHDGTIILAEYYGYACALARKSNGHYDFYYLTTGDNGGGSPNYIYNGLTGWYNQFCVDDQNQYVTVLDSDTSYVIDTNNAGTITFNKFDYGTSGSALLTYLNDGNDWFYWVGTDSAAINYVDGGAGGDTIDVYGGENHVYGRAGDDLVEANNLASVDLGDGNDCLSVNSYVSPITCGTGTDTVYYSSYFGTPTFDACESTIDGYPVGSCW